MAKDAVGLKATPIISKLKASVPCGSNEASTSASLPKLMKNTRPKWIWQPRGKVMGLNQSTETTTASGTPAMTQALTLVPTGSINPKPTIVADHITRVHRSWGSAFDWVLELRDGKRISIPLSLIQQPQMQASSTMDPSDESKVLLLEGFNDLGSSDEGHEESDGEVDEEDDTVSMVWEDPEGEDERGAIVCCEETECALEVEPLASLGPDTTSEHWLAMGTADEVHDSSQPGERIWGKYQEFGQFLGATYEGY